MSPRFWNKRVFLTLFVENKVLHGSELWLAFRRMMKDLKLAVNTKLRRLV